MLLPDSERAVGIHDGHYLLAQKKGGKLSVVDVQQVDIGGSGEETRVVSLPTHLSLVRSIQIPLRKRADCERALPFQVESRLPFPIEEAQLDSLALAEEGGSTDLLYYAAKRGDVEEVVAQQSGEIHKVTPVGSALAQVVSHLVGGERRALLFAEERAITCAVVEEGRLLAAREIGWESSIEHALLSLPKAEGDLLLCGPRLHLLEVEGVEIEITSLIPDGGQQWLLPLGLALVGLQSDAASVNFLGGALAAQSPWRRYRRRLTVALGLFAISILSLFLTGAALRERADQEMGDHYRQIALLAGEEPKQLAGRTALEQARIVEQRARPSDLFPLEPDLPSVSAVLNWLSHHPQLGSAITLTSLRYMLVQYPHVKRTDRCYQLRLDLDFETDHSAAARAFHAALIEPNDWVDPSSEVQWSVTKEGYRTSFVLRDRTFYPRKER